MVLVLESSVLLLSLMYSITLQSSPHQSQHTHIHVHCISQSFPIDFLSVIIHTYMYLQNFNCLLPQARFNQTMSSWLQTPCHFIVVSLLHNFDFLASTVDLMLFNPLHREE